MVETLKNICIYILNNINEEITLEELESTFNYNKFYLVRLFKTYTGFTIKEFINTIKILKTIDPLIFTDDTILKIALTNGFNSQEYYSEKFKDIIGMPPLNFRKEYKNITQITNIEELKIKKEYLIYLKNYQQYLLNIGSKNNLSPSNKTKKLKKVS